jgi:hypothetical protein
MNWLKLCTRIGWLRPWCSYGEWWSGAKNKIRSIDHSSPHLHQQSQNHPFHELARMHTSCTNEPPNTQHQQVSSSLLMPFGKHTKHANTMVTHTQHLPHKSLQSKILASESRKHSASTSAMVSSEAKPTFLPTHHQPIPLAQPTILPLTQHSWCT